ncbi:hypothetical protein CKN73_03025 [Carnobacterium divergens]|uniref:Crp/Fnr family transcriptional regulator n=1 Tax=Carnobacterium divergens TaxID=2748 RepID=UPI0010726386|nr:Crp/Fnr family transcriptional regulator [Carnobacterium divergens]TFJ43628.1 hypothetical protein CKN77_02955 [Carnobacterium divergens]TFJ51458.1 hypothetical protein CKN73_03025 [Carnobacterium divergens]TFJ56448.1 hypothetical protein CKN83_02970 [Carnobacterium divergens]TFJ64088.1 hypothetical protein CKN89_03050 [Carnobacterium divergens]TFJ73407.1 hypothetical protein CKN91_02970 [Carnobacterium divergens]
MDIKKALYLEQDATYKYHQVKIYQPGDIYQYDNGEEEKIVFLDKGAALIQAQGRDSDWISHDLVTPKYIISLENMMTNVYVPSYLIYRVKFVETSKMYIVNREYFLNHLYLNPLDFQEFFESLGIKYINKTRMVAVSNERPLIKVANSLFAIIYTLHPKTQIKLCELPSYVTQKFISEYSSTGKARTSEALKLLEIMGIVEQKKPLKINVEKLSSFISDEH